MKTYKSKIINKREIDWTTPIVISELNVDPNILEEHTKRVNNVFKHLSPEQKQAQIYNIVVRDNIFNKAMDILQQCYDIEYDEAELNEIKESIKNSQYGENYSKFIDDIAEKIIKKELIFADIAKEYNIEVSDEELINVLKSYYEETNQPIRDFMSNKEQFQVAKESLLSEKITSFIIDKFPRDLSELEARLYKSLAEKEKEEGK